MSATDMHPPTHAPDTILTRVKKGQANVSEMSPAVTVGFPKCHSRLDPKWSRAAAGSWIFNLKTI